MDKQSALKLNSRYFITREDGFSVEYDDDTQQASIEVDGQHLYGPYDSYHDLNVKLNLINYGQAAYHKAMSPRGKANTNDEISKDFLFNGTEAAPMQEAVQMYCHAKGYDLNPWQTLIERAKA